MTAAARIPFLITIDTEGDNLWGRPREITTRNSAFLPRFQQLCERHGLRPTWLTNHEMAMCPVYQAFARDVLTRQAGEVGMHLHAWNSPPLVPLTSDDLRHQPFLIEYPDEVMRDKVTVLTSLLEETFQRPMRSHRAGRWAMDRRYARLLVDLGYTSDCSVTPSISWQHAKGVPEGAGGTDYRSFPASPYFMDLERIDRAGDSPLLQVPMTTRRAYPRASALVPAVLQRGPLTRLQTARLWLRPRGGNRADMLRLLRLAEAQQWTHVEFMLHSSEFMPGGSPTFPTERAIDELYADLEVVFASAARGFRGMTMTEYREAFAAA
ncbi:MAG TPA: hypothetical protein VMF13_22285 [Luteitalea sp.]|nr:hypothetical protein [Luteitalea sp.]